MHGVYEFIAVCNVPSEPIQPGDRGSAIARQGLLAGPAQAQQEYHAGGYDKGAGLLRGGHQPALIEAGAIIAAVKARV